MIGAPQLRTTVWAILQTALAAGLAWYLTRDVLGHVAPFFAPISAAVCLWATNVVRAELAIEMVVGVGLGIGLGSGVHLALGSGPLAMAVAVLTSLSAAVLIGRGFLLQRPMFVNQTVMSAILILAFPHGGLGMERLFDALIGGGLAVAFSIVVFPKNPLAVLREARYEVFTALRDIFTQIRRRPGEPDWTLTAAAALHRALARLGEARGTARQLARFCPRRWRLRDATRAADHRAAELALLAASVLQLARTVAAAPEGPPPEIGDLGEAVTALTAGKQAVAAAHIASVRRRTVAAGATTEMLSALIAGCADELEGLLEPAAG